MFQQRCQQLPNSFLLLMSAQIAARSCRLTTAGVAAAAPRFPLRGRVGKKKEGKKKHRKRQNNGPGLDM